MGSLDLAGRAEMVAAAMCKLGKVRGPRQSFGCEKRGRVEVDASFGTKRDGVIGHGSAWFACFRCERGTRLGFVESMGMISESFGDSDMCRP